MLFYEIIRTDNGIVRFFQQEYLLRIPLLNMNLGY